MFKAFFSRKGNETFLKEFLEALLKIEIKKIVIKDEVSIEKLLQWLAFIDDYDRGKIEMAENKNKTLKEARNVMNYLTGDEEIRRLVELRERWAFDRNMDMNYAEEDGKKKKAREIAKKLLKKGVSIEIIMESTGVTKEEIEELAI